MSALEALGTVIMVLLAVGTALALTVVVVLVLAVRSGMRRLRTHPQVRRGVLSGRVMVARGVPQRQAAQLRLRLHDACDTAGRAVAVAQLAPFPGEVAPAASRLQQLAAPLDRQLALLAADRDEHAVRALLPPLAEQVEQVVSAARSLRSATGAWVESASAPALSDGVAEVERRAAWVAASAAVLPEIQEPGRLR